MSGVLSNLSFRAAALRGSATALIIPDERSFTFAEIDALAARFAGGLASQGIERGASVVLYLPNGWRWVVAYHAIARIGAVVIPTNILLTPQEVRYMAQDAGALALIVPDEAQALFDAPVGFVVTPGGAPGTVPFDDLTRAAPLAPATTAPDDLLAISYTSGTTGKPKGVMLSHGNVMASVTHTATIHVRHADDRVYSALPLPHVYGNVVMNACFLTGAGLVCPQRFDAGRAIAAIPQHRITLFEGVPTMYYQMLAHPAMDLTDFSSLTRCTVGGQTMPTTKLDAAAARLGCPVLELWGMTEVAGPATSHSPYWPARHGSIGLPFPGTQVSLRDLEHPGREAARGAPGELAVRGPLVTTGYWRCPDATAEALDSEGWLLTGDIATRDGDGYLFIVDRKKDMILTAGYNIYPAELEQVIAMHVDVGMVAVAGFPDEEKGELAHAFVVPRDGATVTVEALVAHCRSHLAAYKVPRAVHFVQDLPRTSSGKIMRRALTAPDASAISGQGALP
ncbi:AMP-binding protein [uncultured Sphingomonas sp.]|uniref:AMP-binding protein n=1 Tax=uncultured Sphingomonas sp. TaxID=158754 RepID=UPI0035C9DD67